MRRHIGMLVVTQVLLQVFASACSDEGLGREHDAAGPDLGDASADAGHDATIDSAVDLRKSCPETPMKPDGPRLDEDELPTSLPLELLPAGVSAFHYVDCTACDSLSPTFLVRNTGTTELTLDTLEISPGFEVTEPSHLPLGVAPGKSLPITVRFRGDFSVEGVLTVGSNGRISQFQINGIAVHETSLHTRNTLAWDFGDVPVGTSSLPHEILVQAQHGASSAIKIEATIPGASENFTLTPPGPDFKSLASCALHRMEARFDAPRVAGPVEGYVSFDIGPGLVVIYLYGNAVSE